MGAAMTDATPRGTDMANLSERLKDFAAIGVEGGLHPDSVETLTEAASTLDRLTVEGLAGEMAATYGKMLTPGTYRQLAGVLLTYITTPSVEESHD